MDKRQRLNDLKKRFDEISAEYEEVRGDIVYFENEPEFEEYSSCTEDALKKEKFPKEYEDYQKKVKLDDELKSLEQELVDAAKDLTKELNESIEKLEKNVAVNEKYLKEAEEEIKRIKKEIDDLTKTEEYKNGDEEALIKYDNLMKDLSNERFKKRTRETRITKIKEELGTIRAEKEELIETYGEAIDTPVNEKDSFEEPEGDKNTPEGNNNEKGKNTKGTKGGVVLSNASDAQAELSAEEKAKKAQEEKLKKLKEDFTDLSAKAKKGTLTDKELDSFVDILKDKENYEKLGLSMGLFFNKPRGIFKALNKKYKDDESKLASINEAYNVYEEKFYEKHGEEKLKKLSKFFIIDEVERKEATPALPAEPPVDPGKKSLGDALGNKTVPDGEYVDPPASRKQEDPDIEVI